MTRFGPLFFALALCVSACSPKNVKPPVKDWRTANIHKVVVVCIQGGQASSRQVETQVEPILRHQGLEAISSQNLFQVASSYSPKGLMDQMQRARVDGIMELNYSGEIPKQGLPLGIRFKYHSIKGWAGKLSDRPSSLDAAFRELIAGPTK